MEMTVADGRCLVCALSRNVCHCYGGGLFPSAKGQREARAAMEERTQRWLNHKRDIPESHQ